MHTPQPVGRTSQAPIPAFPQRGKESGTGHQSAWKRPL